MIRSKGLRQSLCRSRVAILARELRPGVPGRMSGPYISSHDQRNPPADVQANPREWSASVNVEDAGDFFSEEHSRVAATDIDLLVTNELPLRWIAPMQDSIVRSHRRALTFIEPVWSHSETGYSRSLVILAVWVTNAWQAKDLSSSHGINSRRRHSGCAGFNQVGVVSPCNVRMGAQRPFR